QRRSLLRGGLNKAPATQALRAWERACRHLFTYRSAGAADWVCCCPFVTIVQLWRDGRMSRSGWGRRPWAARNRAEGRRGWILWARRGACVGVRSRGRRCHVASLRRVHRRLGEAELVNQFQPETRPQLRQALHPLEGVGGPVTAMSRGVGSDVLAHELGH